MIAAGYLLGCLIMAIFDDGRAVAHYLLWPVLALTVLRMGTVAAALLFRRRYPLVGLVVACLAMFGGQGAQLVANSVALLVMIYAVPVYRSVAAGWVGYAISVVCGLAQSLLPEGEGPGAIGTAPALRNVGDLVYANASGAIWLLAVLMIGINLGNRRRYVGAIIDRAHQLARERDQLAQLAVAEERARISREIHDIVAHSVSVMITLSEGAAQAARGAPEAVTEAMQRSAETGRTALAQMRRLLGALTETGSTDPDLAPQPGVDDLPALIQGLEEAGLDVVLTVRGHASGDRGQDLAVYRVVQEGLTNVLRYAGPGARAEVTVERSAGCTEVIVRDHGPVLPVSGPASGVGSGRGLRGVAERVRVFGGRIDSGPVSSGGWRLYATIPVRADAREGGQAAHTGGPE